MGLVTQTHRSANGVAKAEPVMVQAKKIVRFLNGTGNGENFDDT